MDMKVFCTLILTVIVAIVVERCRAEFLLVEVDDAAGKDLQHGPEMSARMMNDANRMKEKCRTILGPDGITIMKKPCLFPFTHNKQNVTECVKLPIGKHFYCATEMQYGNWYLEDNYGVCHDELCDVDFGSGKATSDDTLPSTIQEKPRCPPKEIYADGKCKCGNKDSCENNYNEGFICDPTHNRCLCKVGGQPCENGQYCKDEQCSVNGRWGEWNTVGECSKTCGEGWQQWRRKCDAPEPKGSGNNCTGNDKKVTICNIKNCAAPKVCKWFGTAPFCEAYCPSGWEYQRKSKKGDGKRCWTGEKHNCCKTPLE